MGGCGDEATSSAWPNKAESGGESSAEELSAVAVTSTPSVPAPLGSVDDVAATPAAAAKGPASVPPLSRQYPLVINTDARQEATMRQATLRVRGIH
jgi:hypothetical protein